MLYFFKLNFHHKFFKKFFKLFISIDSLYGAHYLNINKYRTQQIFF